MRVGVIGTGFGARVVAPTFAATPGCEVVGVESARNAAAVERLCRRPDIDLVSIHSPPFLHAPHASLALEAGHAVLCDKPLGRGAAESAEMLAAAEAAGVVHLVNFEFRHDPGRRRLRDLVAGGAVGRPEHLQWTHMSAASRAPLRRHGWLFERSRGGGWVGAWGSHAIDTVRWMLGEITEVRARLRTTLTERPGPDGRPRPVDAEDAFTAWLEVEGGVTVAIDTTFSAPVSLAPRIVVIGSEGTLECVGDSRITVRRADGTREEIDVAPSSGDRHSEPMGRWAEVVRDAVHERKQVTPSFADGLACDRVLDRLRGV